MQFPSTSRQHRLPSVPGVRRRRRLWWYRAVRRWHVTSGPIPPTGQVQVIDRRAFDWERDG